MTIYIVSYTSYDDYDDYLYTSRDIFLNKKEAETFFYHEVESARSDTIDEEGENYTFSYDEKKEKNKVTFRRHFCSYQVIVEITEHEI